MSNVHLQTLSCQIFALQLVLCLMHYMHVNTRPRGIETTATTTDDQRTSHEWEKAYHRQGGETLAISFLRTAFEDFHLQISIVQQSMTGRASGFSVPVFKHTNLWSIICSVSFNFLGASVQKLLIRHFGPSRFNPVHNHANFRTPPVYQNWTLKTDPTIRKLHNVTRMIDHQRLRWWTSVNVVSHQDTSICDEYQQSYL
jgi:hypothetical protein